MKAEIKTKAGKGRIVPIHSAVYPLVKHRYEKYGTLLPMCAYNFRLNMYKILNELGIEKHTLTIAVILFPNSVKTVM